MDVAEISEAAATSVETVEDTPQTVDAPIAEETVTPAEETTETATVEVVETAAPVAEAPITKAPVMEAPIMEAPIMEERLGWRQKSLEPRTPRHRHKPKPRAEDQADSKAPRSGKPRHGKGDRKPGGKDRPNDGAPRGPRPEQKPREPYINPYSPFAILREKLGQG